MVSRRILIKHLATLLLGSAFISACTKEQTLLDPKTIARQVAKHYGESSPTVVDVKQTQADGSSNDPMYLIALAGHFHKGSLVATSLGFSALANKMYVWNIRAYDASHQNVWTDDEFRA